MAKSSKSSKKLPPVSSPEAREKQLINIAYDEAEKRIQNGTATSQLLTFFLKLGSMKEKMEMEKLKTELKLSEAKIKQIDSQEDIKELYQRAIEAQKRYRGTAFEEDDDFDDY